jgi:hypothetical protein
LFELRFFKDDEEIFLKKGQTISLNLNPKRGLDQTKLFYRNENEQEWVEEINTNQKFTEQEPIQPCTDIPEFGQLCIKLSDAETAEEIKEYVLMDEQGREMRRCFIDSGYVVFAVVPGDHIYTITSTHGGNKNSISKYNYKVKNIAVGIPKNQRTYVHIQAKSKGTFKKTSTNNKNDASVRQRLNAYRVLDIHPPVRNQKKEKSQLSWNNVASIKNTTLLSKTGIFTIAQSIHQPNKIACTFQWSDSNGNSWKPFLMVGLDLRYNSIQNAVNGVLHFDPNGRNMILAVDQDYRLHVISENTFKHYGINKSGVYSVTGENYSNEILNISDLRKLLNH